MKETYDTMKLIIDSIKYSIYNWKIVSDLKVLTILLGMQGGYTKYPCYMCEWDSRAINRYERREWPSRSSIKIGQKNVLNIPLVKTENIILPPLHLKLGYMKQFVKALDTESEAFKHLKSVFPGLSDAKVKGGIFIGPQIRKIMKDEEFLKKLTDIEKRAWESFISLCDNFLGNNKSENYIEVVEEFLMAYSVMGCNMSIKIHFLHSHIDFFPNNLGHFSDEQGERFHQEISKMEKRFEGKNKIKMMSNYCWTLKRDTSDDLFKRKRSVTHF